MRINGRVLVVAGSDSSGGTGIQANVKTITALGGYATTAVTALTARDTKGAMEIQPVPASFVQQQMRLALTDIGADVIHLGALHTAELINAVTDVIEELAPGLPVILDPVAVTKSGRSMLDQEGMRHLKIRLLPIATCITPNLREAELLAGMDIDDIETRRHAAMMMLTLGAKSVLLKGGHGDEDPVIDLLATEDGMTTLTYPRQSSRHVAGIGSTLSAAIACYTAQGKPIVEAVKQARGYVQECIRQAPGYGQGSGPVNHAVTVQPMSFA
ncbi:bifunctional hydroxymethylpyrimidine kinase/phosphomethylpyrimidine kinase [Lacibacterium aquatile]|uniref:hydroxymethylpyrimidine kinase n=1 Tax=Lacibacterium aquatile TaxID=1168082 RepID=A0ABW5DVY1_9PROT